MLARIGTCHTELQLLVVCLPHGAVNSQRQGLI